MINTRSLAASEAGWFSGLGAADVLPQLEAAWRAGTSRPEWTLVVESDGAPVARGALLAAETGGGVATLEGTASFLWTDFEHPRHCQAFRALVDAMADLLAPHGPTTLDRRLNLEVDRDVEPMRRLLEASEFGLFQEKTGFTWTPSVASLPASKRLRLASLESAGPDAFGSVMAATTVGTLDRNDRYYIAQCGARPWAAEIMTALNDGDEESWLLGYHNDEPAGFVAVGAFDEETWTIVHIGVVPEHRGHGHVHELLAAADGVVRARGFRAGLSDVDVENGPMIGAMLAAGHRTDVRPWHIWHYRRKVTPAVGADQRATG